MATHAAPASDAEPVAASDAAPVAPAAPAAPTPEQLAAGTGGGAWHLTPEERELNGWRETEQGWVRDEVDRDDNIVPPQVGAVQLGEGAVEIVPAGGTATAATEPAKEVNPEAGTGEVEPQAVSQPGPPQAPPADVNTTADNSGEIAPAEQS